MDLGHLARLSGPLRSFIEEVEAVAAIHVDVELDVLRNDKGPRGSGALSAVIEPYGAVIHAPTNGYFPDGAVRHEVLHVHRLHVDQVPRLALAEAVDLAPEFEAGLIELDNDLEHLVIVPIELQHHPERMAHWEASMRNYWETKLPQASALDGRIGACLHGAFMRHVLPNSTVVALANAAMDIYGLRDEAAAFANRCLPLLGDKVALVVAFFDWFDELPRDWAELNYLSSTTGLTRQPIPS